MNGPPPKFLSDNRKSKIQNRKWVGIFAIALAFVFGGIEAGAQQPAKIPRIGYVSGAGDHKTPGLQVETFRQGLRDLGYVEEKNILIEHRYEEGNQDRVPRLVAELIQLNVDVLICATSPGIRAAKQATKTIPIVMVTTSDPIATGLIDSLARPGGNIIGITRLTRDLNGKRLEILVEAVPGVSRVGVLFQAESSGPIHFKEYEAAARVLKIPLQPLELRRQNPNLETAFQTAVKGRVAALITIRNAFTAFYRKQISDLAVKNQLPSMYEVSDHVEAGGLMSYATHEAESFRRAAVFVDKILKGTKPADLPVEQPTKFEFVINLKTAKQIGLTIPPNVLARADRIIR